MGGLEPAHELVERVQHLLGKAFAHLVLVLAAVLQQRREPLVAGQCEEALLGEEQAESGAQGASRGTGHVGDAKVHSARAFAARGGDGPERDAVEEQARGDPGAAKQALRSPVGRSFEPSTRATARRRIEVPSCVQNPNQKLPRRLPVARIPFTDREVRAQRLPVVRERKLELRRNRGCLGAGVAPG